MVRILVIDDEDLLRDNIAEILQLSGYDTLTAENGAKGIQAAQTSLPDLIVCDVMMPGLNGYDVVQTLQSDPATAVIPFLFLTANVDAASRRRGMEGGADDYLTKPFVPDDLLMAVRKRLEKRALLSQKYEQRFDELRGNLVSILPHELRTPLNIIMGYAELMLMDADTLTPDTVRMVETITQASRRLQHVIENYLLYAQTEIQLADRESAAAFAKHQFETPGMLIKDVARKIAEGYDRLSDLSLRTENVPVVIAGDLLRKLLEETIDNAFKFSKAGSKVDVSVERVQDQYHIRIRDQGRGMTAEQIDRVGAYEQFNRHIFEQQGMGLGLILAKRFAELHGGELRISSVPDQGTTIDVRLRLVG